MKKQLIIMIALLALIIFVSIFVQKPTTLRCTEAGHRKTPLSSCCEDLIEIQEDISVGNDVYCAFKKPNIEEDCITAGKCFHITLDDYYKKGCCKGTEFIFTSKSTGCCMYL